MLKVRLTSPPVEGKANKQLITFLSENFKIKKSEIKIVSGLKSREKLIEISVKANPETFINAIKRIKS